MGRGGVLDSEIASQAYFQHMYKCTKQGPGCPLHEISDPLSLPLLLISSLISSFIRAIVPTPP